MLVIRREKLIYLSGGLVESEVVSQLFLTDGTRSINLVTQDEERNLGKLFNREQGIEFSF